MTDVVGSNFGNPKHVGLDMTKWDLTPLQSGEITSASSDSVTIDVGHHHYVLTVSPCRTTTASRTWASTISFR